jgi:hypothetical protein
MLALDALFGNDKRHADSLRGRPTGGPAGGAHCATLALGARNTPMKLVNNRGYAARVNNRGRSRENQ